MSINVGTIYYTVEADTSQLVNGGDAIDRSLGRAEGSMKRADATADKFNGRMKKTAVAVKQANKEIADQSSGLSSLTKILVGYLSLRTLQAVASLSDQYGQMASRIRNATASAAEYEMVQARLLETANGTYRALSEAQEVYLATEAALKDLGYTTEDVLDISDSLSYAFVRDAARADQATTAMDAYSKALMKGKIEADAWASMLAATPSIVDGIADATGRSREEIRKLGATGKLSVEALNEGLRRSRDENKAFADEMETSTQDAVVAFTNALTVFVGKVNESAGASGIFTEAMAKLASLLQDPKTIDAAVQMATGVVNALNSIISVMGDTVDFVKWGAEAIAAALHGPAADDIVRLQDRLANFKRMRDANIFSQLVDGYSSKEIEDEIKRLEFLIDNFYKSERKRPPITVPKVTGAGDSSGAAPKLVDAEAPAKATKQLTAEQKAAQKAEKELDRARQENVDVLADLSTELRLASLSGRELAEAQALLKLNEYASPEQIEGVKRLVAELHKIDELNKRRAEFGTDVAGSIRGTVTPLSGGQFDDQVARYEAEARAEKQRYADQLARLQEAKELELEVKGGYMALEEQMAKEHADRIGQIEQAKNQVLLQSAETAAGAMAAALGQMVGESSGAYRTMFALAKGFAIANAGLNLTTAIMQAMADPSALTPAQKFANWAAVAAAGSSLISQISSATYSGRQYGGPVSPGSMYRINETGAPEVFNAANGRQYMLPNQRGEVVSNRDAKSGPSVINQISITIDSGGTGTVSSSATTDQEAMQLANAVKLVVVDELERQSRPGGVLWRQTYNGY